LLLFFPGVTGCGALSVGAGVTAAAGDAGFLQGGVDGRGMGCVV
jgi:hypothetical protein